MRSQGIAKKVSLFCDVLRSLFRSIVHAGTVVGTKPAVRWREVRLQLISSNRFRTCLHLSKFPAIDFKICTQSRIVFYYVPLGIVALLFPAEQMLSAWTQQSKLIDLTFSMYWDWSRNRKDHSPRYAFRYWPSKLCIDLFTILYCSAKLMLC